MIRPCADADFDAIHAIINDAAQAYCGVIPSDCWHVLYMSKEYLLLKTISVTINKNAIPGDIKQKIGPIL